ncbi:MAG: sulfatase-like hydrolase/transferase [Rhodospirillales bacterium]|nr:sulfatase-like hydrolase/transferase [Rhodospirillales bacterium]
MSHVNYRQAIKIFAVLICLISACPLKAAERPNIIFVLCDDLGPGDIGILWQNGREGTQKFSTPHLDTFAQEGMILTRHYCPAPVCAPSRGSLLTGRHQGHCAVRDQQFDKELPDEYTLGSVMQKAGYATAAIGKWGLQGGKYVLCWPGQRGDRSPELEPGHALLRGFDYFYGYTGHVDGHYHYPFEDNRPMYDGYKDVTDGLAKCYTTDLFTARTKKWIEDHHEAHSEQPFFIYLAYDTPHSKQQVPTTSHLTAESNYPEGGGLTGGVQWNEDASGGQINTAKGIVNKGMHPAFANAVGDDGQPWPEPATRHVTMVRRIGDAVEDIVQLLKDLGIDEDTLIVFTSDNGTHPADRHQPDYFDTFGPYDGRKRDMWEGGIRMPTLVRWPSVIAAGSKSDSPSQSHDWMATFSDLVGMQPPALCDGVSIAPTLTGRGKQRLGIVYSEYSQPGGRTADYIEFEPSRRGRPQDQMQSILIGDYKGVRVDIKNQNTLFEVYHTLDDIKETTNLAGMPGVPTQQQFEAAVLRLRRTDPSAPRPYDNALIPSLTGDAIRPGLIRKEYPGDFDWVPQFHNLTPSDQTVVNGLVPTAGAQQFVGFLTVPVDGVYDFALTTPQGKAIVRLHDALLINADTNYAASTKALSGAIALQAGLHPLRINYLAGTDAAPLTLEWRLPGGEMTAIPSDQFCLCENTEDVNTSLAFLIRDDWMRQAAAPSESGPLTAEDDAAGGCDGIKDGLAGFHTQQEQDPWWQVDLGSVVPLSQIVLWNRTGGGSAVQRARQLVVRLSADGQAWEEIYRHDGSLFYGFSGGVPLTVSAPGKTARYVRVGLADNEYFHLDEVEVYGTDNLETNLALDRPATQSSTSNWSTPRKKPVSVSFRIAAGEALDLATATRTLMEGSDRLSSYDSALAELQERYDEAGADADFQELYIDTRQLRRELILSHPTLDFDRLLINKRPPPRYHAHMCEQYLGRNSAAGPGLVILDSWRDDPQATVLLEGKLPEGSVLHPDLSFDAERVIFSFADHTVVKNDNVTIPIHQGRASRGFDNNKYGRQRFLLYEATLDGETVRQLTGTPSDPMETAFNRATVLIEDLDPCYMPDGGIVFTSTRSQNFGRCHGGVYKPAFLLYRAEADGSNIRQISFAEANEWDPSVLPDGRIIYTRWDYINRHNTWFQSLWTTKPDGTATDHYYGNYTRNPCVISEAHSIPGSNQVVATAAAHHFITGGSIITVDTQQGRDGPGPLTRITPEVHFPETEGWDTNGCYATPYPLSEELFLAAYTTEPINYGERPSDAAFGIYLVDSLGGRELIYRDAEVSCFTPLPVRPRSVPPVIPSILPDPDQSPATGMCYVQDVYQCPEPIPEGSIKYLRINRIHDQPTPYFTIRSRANQEVVKSVIGVVPVNEDGSAAFEVPADTGFQLQALDENGMAVMTMRSLMYVRPGEVMGCVGCHEYQAAGQAAAAHSPPRMVVNTPEPLPGPQYEGGFSFMRTVQPVLDRHCIRCHGLGEKPAGDLNLLADHAYASLTSRPGLVAIALSNQETFVSSPMDYFAHAGRLADILLAGKMGEQIIDLPRDDLNRIIAWLDLNGQQFGDYSFNRVEDRTADPEGEQRLREAVSEKFGPAMAGRPFAALVNVGQPDESLILRAPLALESGGWGQHSDTGWDSEQHPEFQRFQQLVDAAIAPMPYVDVQGTCAQQPCVCGSCWVRELTQQGNASVQTE